MTIEIQEYKCPSCGHLLGQNEYLDVCKKHQRQQNQEVESLVSSRMKKERHELVERLSEEKNKHTQEIQSIESQIENLANEKSRLAIAEINSKNRQTEEEHKEQIRRLTEHNKSLEWKVEEQRKTLEKIPGHLAGQAGENGLLNELKQEFKTDEFICKKNGVAMADIIQIIVTEKGERIATPIVYDKKTSRKVYSSDLEKAKNYKRIHKTDHCIIVTGDIKETLPPRFTEVREGVLLAHPTVVVDIAKRIRSYLVEASRIDKINGCGTTAKDKLYEFLSSSEYNRDRQARIEAKLRLDETQRDEEESLRKIWRKREEQIRKWFELDTKLDAFISHITQEDENDDDGDNPST